MLDINTLIEKLNFTNDVSEFLITYTLDESEYERYKKLFYEDFMLFLKSIKSKEDKYLFSLKLYICLAAENYDLITKRLYEKESILDDNGLNPETVYFDTISDIRIWQEVHKRKTGEIGLSELYWVANCVKGDLYRFGRLQFEPDKSTDIVHIHIPEGKNLDVNECINNINLAKNFFDGCSGFDCESWLLSPNILSLLPKESNIRKFQALFDVQHIKYDFAQASERVLNEAYSRGQNSSLYQKLKEYVKENGDPGIGYGVYKKF